MKLSEAIRLGAMLHPQQCYGSNQMTSSVTGEVLATCALGAAEQAGFSMLILGAMQKVACPGTGCANQPPTEFWRAIAHLNDIHHWSRERIADWVATVEPPEASSSVREDVRSTDLVDA